MDETMNFLDNLSTNPTTAPLTDLINSIIELPENAINDNTIQIYSNIMNAAFSTQVIEAAAAQLIEDWDNSNFTRRQVRSTIDNIKKQFDDIIKTLQPSEKKSELLYITLNSMTQIFDYAEKKYHGIDINLPLKLDEGASIPKYAHNDDAAADLFALETITIPAHSLSNRIHTGVSIALPEGWMAMIFPRSSIGAKTGLRLSNSVGIIDNSYRGELGVLYDNISDSDYTINAGDRIAQMLVLPSYHFAAVPVNELEETERNDGGFGSTGK